MTKYLHIFSNVRKPFLIYYFTPDPIRMYLYMRKIFLLFYQCVAFPLLLSRLSSR